MPKSTLQVIRNIEDEAKKIQKSYDEKIEKVNQQTQIQLDEVSEKYDVETKKIIAELEKELDTEIAVAKSNLEKVEAQNRSKSEEALTKKKDELIKHIVNEVISRYGN